MLWRLLHCAVLGLSASVLFGLPSRAKGDIIRQEGDVRHSNEVSQACYYPRSYWTSHLTAHGLWPEYETGDWPSFCTSEKFDVAKVTDAVGLERMKDMWPSVEAQHDDTSLWKHEWDKHGTCTSLTQEQYFLLTLDLIDEVGTPQSLVENIGQRVYQESIKAFFGELDIVLTCEYNVLMEIRLCYKRSRNGKIEERANCPGKTTTCQGTIYVPHFLTSLQ